MYLIYVIEKLIGRYGTIKEAMDIKMTAPSKKIAIEWIEENKEEGGYGTKDMGSTGSSSFVTEKWTWSPRAFSIRAVVPTAPTTIPSTCPCWTIIVPK